MTHVRVGFATATRLILVLVCMSLTGCQTGTKSQRVEFFAQQLQKAQQDRAKYGELVNPIIEQLDQRMREVEDVFLRGALWELKYSIEPIQSADSNDRLEREIVNALMNASTADFYCGRYFSILQLRMEGRWFTSTLNPREIKLRGINYTGILAHQTWTVLDQVQQSMVAANAFDDPEYFWPGMFVKSDSSVNGLRASGRRTVKGLMRLFERQLEELALLENELFKDLTANMHEDQDEVSQLIEQLGVYRTQRHNLSRLFSAFINQRFLAEQL